MFIQLLEFHQAADIFVKVRALNVRVDLVAFDLSLAKYVEL